MLEKKYNLFGFIPILKTKDFGYKIKAYLFNFFPVLKIKKFQHKTNFYLLCLFPIFKIRIYSNKKKYYLFNILPIYKVKWKMPEEPILENKTGSNASCRDLLEEYWKQNPQETIEKRADGLDIAFIIPPAGKNGGGHRNIFRAARQLAKSGHKVTLYVCGGGFDIDEQRYIINTFYYPLKHIDIISYEGELKEHDVCIATFWLTVYEMYKNKDKIKQMFYFVQDYEPMFYAMGTEYILAENTYKLGIPCITSGYWPAKLLKEKYNAQAEHFSFPLDTTVYNTNLKRTKTNKNIVFFARPEMPRRCFPLGIKALKIVKDMRPDIEIILYGSELIKDEYIGFEATLTGSLPSINDLAALYRNADLGIAFSTTNPSLVPYEMMACNLAVADLNFADTEFKYGNESNIVLLNTLPEVMAQEIISIMDNDKLRSQKAANGRNFVSRVIMSEEEMGQRIEDIILRKIRNGGGG